MPLRRSSWCRRPYSGCTWSRGRSGATNRRRSNAASSTLRTVAQSSPAVAAKPTYLVTTPLEMPSAAAICWCDILASSFKRNTSFILRILILGTGTLSPDKCWERTRSVAICVTSFRCCTTPFRYRDRRFRHRDRRFRWRPKSVTIDRNGWSRWTGMTGHDRPESLVTIDRNTQFILFAVADGVASASTTCYQTTTGGCYPDAATACALTMPAGYTFTKLQNGQCVDTGGTPPTAIYSGSVSAVVVPDCPAGESYNTAGVCVTPPQPKGCTAPAGTRESVSIVTGTGPLSAGSHTGPAVHAPTSDGVCDVTVGSLTDCFAHPNSDGLTK